MPRAFFLAAALLAAALICQAKTAAAQDGDMQWQFFESNDPDNKGAMTARLVYGVPETDNVQVMGVCDARPSTSAQFANFTFGADIGGLANGADAALRFSGGGFEETLEGYIQRAEGEGLSGVNLDIENDDQLWAAFVENETLDYSVPGYRAASLNLAEGRDNLKKFVEACRSYEQAVLGDGAGAEAETAEASASPEKEAFDSAKELGTAAGFEAFLANYPSGFYADLARAYIDKLEAAEAPPAPARTPPPPAPAPKPAAASGPGADPSCKDLFSVKSQGSDAPAKITFINKSGMYRSILWLDFSGQPKDYAGLNNGEEVTLDTFLTHPWMVTDGPGDCIEIFMPHAGTRVVTLKAPDGSEKAAAPPPPDKKASPPPPPAPKKAATPKCKSRSVLVDGKCILKRNAASYCGPGYRLEGNKCVQGYVKPKPQRQLPTWQLEAIKKGCKPGQGWNAQEGCHEDD